MLWPAIALPVLLAILAGDDLNRTCSFEEIGLTLELPDLEGLAELDQKGEQRIGMWSGTLGESKVTISMWLLPSEGFGFQEPEDVTDLIAENFRRKGDPGFYFENSYLVEGAIGFAPYGSIGTGARMRRGSTQQYATTFLLGLLLENHGACVEVEVRPPVTEAEADVILEFLETGVSYQGPERNHRWTDDEAEVRWNQHAPESARGKKFKKPYRTKHYIILTNSSGDKSFGKKMEENYKKIQKVYPFEEAEGRKLMPVFLFRTNQQYYEFCVSVAGWTVEQAKESKGHAWKDYYATWYESPNDPVHIHEATHQIFMNRLRLSGGGSWFQEGVAEYIETKKNDRNVVASLAEKGSHTPLRDLMTLESLLGSSGTDQRTGDLAGRNYKQAALTIEFLRESRFGKEKFWEFVQAIGRVPRGDLGKIEQVLQQVYGVDIDGLDAEFQDYCKKR